MDKARVVPPVKDETIVSYKNDWGSIVQFSPLFSSDSSYLLVVTGKTIKVLSTDTGSLVEEHLHHKEKIVGMCKVEDGEDMFVSCDEIGTIWFWSLQTKNKKKKAEKFVLDTASFKKSWGLNTSPTQHKLTSFLYSHIRKEVYVVMEYVEKPARLLLRYPAPFNTDKPHVMSSDVQLGENKVAVSSSGHHVAYLTREWLYITTKYRMDELETRIRHGFGTRVLTCVAFHPDQDVLATGDNTGRMLLWHDFNNKHPKKQINHWHQLSLAHLAFSKSGVEVYTGGGECVLVKWHLHTRAKYFLPRTGMPIKYVVTDETNKLIAMTHIDNAITLINAQSFKIEGAIQGFAMNVESSDPFPVGIVYDPRTHAVVTNGKTGHVQFYDTDKGKMLYHIDITLSNYYTQELNEKIYNTEVCLTALSPDGTRMATVESRDDNNTARELRLKFWSFSLQDREWSLNTSIDMPHQKTINGLTFHPDPSKPVFCVTSSQDGKFKIWEERDTSDIYGNKSSWNCSGVGFYRHLPAITVQVSPDASLLAASFNNILTLWDPSPCNLKGTLSQPYLAENIIQIEFGRGEGCRSLVVTRSEEWLCVWNLLTCSLLWRVSINSTCMAADPLSPYMAIFTQDCDLFIFDPRRSKVVSLQQKAVPQPPLSVAFIPRTNRSNLTSFWNDHSALFYIGRDQSLHTLEVARDLTTAKEAISGNVRQLVMESEGPPPILTPFAALLAPSRTAHSIQTQEEQAGSAGFGLQLEKSTLFVQKMLNEARVYRLDSFAQLTLEFCKMVLPESQTSEEKQIQEEFEFKLKEKQESNKMTITDTGTLKKKKKKKELKQAAESDFSDLIEMLKL